MTTLLLHTNASITSLRAPSVLSLSTTNPSDTDTTVSEGIGTASGRAIYAVGAAALKGIETFAIRRRLRIINAFFPHGNDVFAPNIEVIYHDTLELSRPGLYRAQVRKQTLQVLMIQIARRQTRHLLRYLARWPSIEIELFLSDILTCLPPEWLPLDTRRTDMHRGLLTEYLLAQEQGLPEHHPASPIVEFIAQLAKMNYTACQAVLDAGFLDALLQVYSCSFVDLLTLSHAQHSIIEARRKDLSMTCVAALAAVGQQPDVSAQTSTHPIRVLLWRPVPSTLAHRASERRSKWRELGHDIVTRRLASFPKIMHMPINMAHCDWAELTDMCIDLVEFSREHWHGSDNAGNAVKVMQQCFELRGAYEQALRAALDEISTGEREELMFRLPPVPPGSIKDNVSVDPPVAKIIEHDEEQRRKYKAVCLQ